MPGGFRLFRHRSGFDSMKPPAFQFYPGDYLSSASVQLLTLEEEGIYIRLLCYCWKNGSIPSDPEICARLVGKGALTTPITNVQQRFKIDPLNPSRMIHERLEREREKQESWIEKSRIGGKKGAAKRWGTRNCKKNGGGHKMVKDCSIPNDDSSSSSSSSSSNKEQGVRDVEEIYAAYPRKVSRKDALIAIAKALKKCPKEVLLRKTIEFAESVKGEEPRYIPHPATWFNAERYNDELELFKPKSDLAIRYANHPCNRDSKNFTYDYTPEQADEFRNLKAEYERQAAT